MAAACCCDHSSDGPGAADGESLLPFIDTVHVSCLNEKEAGSAVHVFKPFTAKADRHCSVESPDGDSSLVFKIPFTSAVKVRSVCISAEPGLGPARVKIFVDQEALAFEDAVEGAPAQELRTPDDPSAELWHPLKVSKFATVRHLTLAMPGETTGGDSLRIFYIGLKGESNGHKRGIVQAVYEARPMPGDHKVDGDAAGAASRMGST